MKSINLKRRIACLAGCMVLTFALAAPSFASDAASTGSIAADISASTVTGQDTAQNQKSEYQSLTDPTGSQSCSVYATFPSSMVVQIPKTVILGGNASSATGTYTIRVSGDVSGTVSVVPSSAFTMQQTGKTSVSASVTQQKTSFTASEVADAATTTGTVTAKGLSSGKWNGAFTFTISLS